jgi:hypothetical protein
MPKGAKKPVAAKAKNLRAKVFLWGLKGRLVYGPSV